MSRDISCFGHYYFRGEDIVPKEVRRGGGRVMRLSAREETKRWTTNLSKSDIKLKIISGIIFPCLNEKRSSVLFLQSSLFIGKIRKSVILHSSTYYYSHQLLKLGNQLSCLYYILLLSSVTKIRNSVILYCTTYCYPLL